MIVYDEYTVSESDAPKIYGWIEERGGILIWRTLNLSDPGQSWTTPAITKAKTPVLKPHYYADDKPSQHITSADQVWVSKDEEFKRFRVAVRRGSNGLTIKLTDASTRKVERALEQAGDGSYYVFDYSAQEVVIYKRTGRTTLQEWWDEWGLHCLDCGLYFDIRQSDGSHCKVCGSEKVEG